MHDCAKLLNGNRRKVSRSEKGPKESRTPFERDFDRILFSTPLRRLADKTQVFPLERNDSVRTRLTHSFEVSNLARSLGVDLAYNHGIADKTPNATRNIPAMLAAVALAHDLGNPPFGHQGEEAIRDWFAVRKPEVLKDPSLSTAMRNDFLEFEGNAQTFRLVTRLQLINDDFGLNLSYGTLAGLLKYTVASDRVDRNANNAGALKPGFFQSEKDIVAQVQSEVGLVSDRRHPLTYIVEACDDVTYSIIDAEDAVKKNLASYPDLEYSLRQPSGGKDTKPTNALVELVIQKVSDDRKEWELTPLSPAELNDLSMQKFRVHAMSELVTIITDTFMANLQAITDGTFEDDLLANGDGKFFIKRLKKFDRQIGYKHRSVLEIELRGHDVLHALMDQLWLAITERDEIDEPGSKRKNPRTAYIYGRISENYRRIFESSSSTLPIRYREAQLLTDMISGMTDQFAFSLYEELRALGVE
jgi:dGTPase